MTPKGLTLDEMTLQLVRFGHMPGFLGEQAIRSIASNAILGLLWGDL
jgi:hypothetical protein